MTLRILVAALISYFLGNHNGAVCISAMLHDDVREHGSGNAGLTNFIRNYGASRSVLVILIDALKAVLGCALGALMFPDMALTGKVFCGAAVMLGHDYPALLGFRGGKGVLSGFFIALMIDWRAGLLIAVVFFVTYLLTGYVSLGSVLGAITFGVAFFLFHPGNAQVLIGTTFMSVLTVFQHRANIRRLLKGEERKTNLFAKGKAQ